MSNVLRLSESAALALHAMVLFAKSEGEPVSNEEAATAFHASANTLAKVLQRLGRAGLLESVRGPRGGFTLARKPATIRLLEIYEAVEGPLGKPSCLLAERVCDGTDCVLSSLVRETQDRMRKYLSGTTLADLAGRIEIEPAGRT